MSDVQISINKLIVHILDNTVGMPVLSDIEHTLEADVENFLIKHISKLFKDINTKKVFFKDAESDIKRKCTYMSSNSDDFINITQEISTQLFDIMYKNPDIPAADVAFTIFKMDNVKYLAILKLNYKPSYIHFINENTDGRENRIIRQKTTLPSESQRIDEAVIVNLQDYSLFLKEKKYEIEGAKQFYLSTLLFNTTEVFSDKEKLDIINKASKKIVKKYYDGDYTKMAEIKNEIAESVEKSKSINLNEITNKVFPKNPDMKKSYIEEVNKSGIEDNAIRVSENAEKKVSKKHKIVTDNNIEISLPPAYLTNKETVEFLTNPDGSISIVLKNIKSIKDK